MTSMRVTKQNLAKMGVRPDGYTIGKERKTFPDRYTRRKDNLRLTVEFKKRVAHATVNGRGNVRVKEIFDLLDVAYKAGIDAGRCEAKQELRDWLREDE